VIVDLIVIVAALGNALDAVDLTDTLDDRRHLRVGVGRWTPRSLLHARGHE
jgi:hypothetical protein